jgi:hypothetical protein
VFGSSAIAKPRLRSTMHAIATSPMAMPIPLCHENASPNTVNAANSGNSKDGCGLSNTVVSSVTIRSLPAMAWRTSTPQRGASYSDTETTTLHTTLRAM